MKISKEIKVAILVLLGIVLFIFGFNYLKGQNLLSSSRTFYVEYDNVESLTASTPVTINGFHVGKVVELNFKGDSSGMLRVKMIVESEFEFSKNSIAELYGTGLMGGKAIRILPAFDGAEKAQDGAVLKGRINPGLSELVNQRLTPLQEKIEVAMSNLGQFLNNLNDVFDEKMKNDLKHSITSLGTTLESFKQTSNSLNHLVESNKKHVDSVLNNAETFTKSLNEAEIDKTIKQLDATLKSFDSILKGIEKGQGTLGKLVKDDKLYDNLTGTSKEMEELLRDIKLHPKRYTRILSKKEIPYTPSK